MALRTYSIYTQCEHCGVYDLDPRWCDLCQRPKTAGRDKPPAAPAHPHPSARGSPASR